jgi:FlaA1/EpsC-like NDP-sugar epimerase
MEAARWLTEAKARLLDWLVGLPRGSKRALLMLADLLMVPACLWFAFALKGDSFTAGLSQPWWMYGFAALAGVAFFLLFGLYKAVTRYIGFRVLGAVLGGACVASGSAWLVGENLAPYTLSATVSVIFGLNVLFWVSATRLLARWLLSMGLAARKPVVIYGAGEAGMQLATALSAGGRMHPVACVDEKSSLWGSTVNGVRVISSEYLPDVIRNHGVSTVLLAIPSASRRRRSEIIEQMSHLGVKVQTVPDVAEMLLGRATVSDVRDISVADLLGREPIPPDQRLLGKDIRGKCVMVTGAGGSIGSELCRQIVLEQPSRLVLFELSELALYDIKRELDAIVSGQGSGIEVVALLGNARDRQRVEEIFRSFAVKTVYHAAAYKHVPIVEENIIEGVRNNVFATWHVAEAAVDVGVESVVLISTDKAVHPTGVMGATKRLAEIVLQAMHGRQVRTRFSMVRFGNVLASSGSVVPLFEEQIKAGGPVTVTHPEVRRYFMTIPEAASLVLQAGSMAKGGEVFLLDMGQPVKIDELARRMIALSGLSVRDAANPEGDIEVRYTGLRPAEKLYEELLIGNQPSGTQHPMIMQATEHAPAWEELHALLEGMQAALDSCDCNRVRELLVGAVCEYRPSEVLHDLVWARRPAGEQKVSGLQAARHLRAVPPPA